MEPHEKQLFFVIREGPYGSERPYNAVRHAMELAKDPDLHVRLCLVGDGVQCAVAGQEIHEGYYNVERMMSSLVRRGEVAT